ncbi:MAG: hypothetical protein ACLUCH_07810 [Lachnospirales bacterium]
MIKIEKWEDLTISNDFLFSKLMRDKEICKEIIEILLNIKVGDITYLEEQKTIDIIYDKKSVRLDVYVEDENKIDEILEKSMRNGVNYIQKKDFKINDFLQDIDNLKRITDEI